MNENKASHNMLDIITDKIGKNFLEFMCYHPKLLSLLNTLQHYNSKH